MSYFQDHGISEEATRKPYINPDISNFIPPAVQQQQTQPNYQLAFFEAIRRRVDENEQENPMLDNLITQLLQESQAQHKSIPTSKEIISNLKLISPKPKENCNICLDEFPLKSKNVVELECFHLFHDECIIPWLELNHTCPCCRHEFRTDDLEYEKQKQITRDAKIREEDSEEEWDPFYS
jgi:hypothetical protein